MPMPDDPAPEPQIERLLGSEELVQAVENDHFRQLLDHVPIGIALSRLTNNRERIVYANDAFMTLMGFSQSDLAGKDWSIFDNFHHEDVAAVTLGGSIDQGEDFLGTFRRQPDDANALVVQAYVGLVETHDGTETCRILAVVDVSARERGQRDELERRIRDKDLLLKELQHRVRNNLQLITALIRLEARTAVTEEANALSRLAGRIEALSLLYQTMSQEDFGSEIDLGAYLSQIAAAVVRAHAVPGIELDLKVAYAPASVNVAMPAGLLVNEMLVNAFKHAFAGREGGKLTVECHYTEGHFHIMVADDGIGLPPGMAWPERGKLGSLVVQTLRENAGSMSLRIDSASGQGTRLNLTFVHRTDTKVH